MRRKKLWRIFWYGIFLAIPIIDILALCGFFGPDAKIYAKTFLKVLGAVWVVTLLIAFAFTIAVFYFYGVPVEPFLRLLWNA